MNTTYFLNCLAGNVFKSKTDDALPQSFYLGLSRGHPDKSGNGVQEPSGGGYARVEITGFTEPDEGVVSNSTDIEFAESTEDWGVITDYVIYDAQTQGHLLMFDNLRDSKTKEPVTRTVEADTVMRVKTGSLQLWFKDDDLASGE